MFSGLRNRYFLPNMAVTEQKLQSNGQPQLVMMGVWRMRSLPLMRVRSAKGSASRSATGGRSGLWRTVSPWW